jgi:hypothetical protein
MAGCCAQLVGEATQFGHADVAERVGPGGAFRPVTCCQMRARTAEAGPGKVCSKRAWLSIAHSMPFAGRGADRSSSDGGVIR